MNTAILGGDLAEFLADRIPKAAMDCHKAFPLITRNDFEQEMWLRAIRSADRFKDLLWQTNGQALIWNELRRAGWRYGQADDRDRRARKAAAAGYSTWDEFFFDRRMVGHLVAELIQSEWDLPYAMDRATKGTDLTGVRVQNGDDSHDSFMSYLALLTDVKDAWESLSAGQQNILTVWFQEGADDESAKWDHEAIASSMGLSYDALRMRKNRAIDNLIRALGGESPYVRAKRRENEAA